MKLEAGQVAVVTGAANGIGQAVAQTLGERGLRVVLADLEGDRLTQVAGEVPTETLAVPVDVADAQQVQKLAESALERFGQVDLVFNNAGISAGGPTWQIGSAEWQRVLAVNLEGVLNGIRAFVPQMIAAGRGHVVNTASVAGLTIGPFNVPYTASKHAVVALSESLQAELSILAPEIGVTVVCPGPVDTRLLRSATEGVADLLAGGPEAFRGNPEAGWLADLTPEQWDRISPMFKDITAIGDQTISAREAAGIILAAVEADRLYVTTHPEYAAGVRERADRIIADMRASR
ncbi:SDR family NAD(P)-dependent oxidoreductase [Nocardia transvalensis]|uniref:SDR family NAD(P)-dependent oxidoreductase n=1 Tax=Nocardia transvalensis TaxID=37333 RepID=UPI00189608BA|nr:SDR family NAD(P)-dependent oxidoreductase [Nocardia transvalensis]MBF6328927.1 SDR family NAD(P)-dependent oxidoreductase [Nocardia transvalensis]